MIAHNSNIYCGGGHPGINRPNVLMVTKTVSGVLCTVPQHVERNQRSQQLTYGGSVHSNVLMGSQIIKFVTVG